MPLQIAQNLPPIVTDITKGHRQRESGDFTNSGKLQTFKCNVFFINILRI